MGDQSQETWKRTSLALPQQTVDHLERLRREWGLRHRGAVLERLLQQVFGDDDGEVGGDLLPDDLESVAERRDDEGELNEQVALVLIGRGAIETLHSDDDSTTATDRQRTRGSGGGIDLPGFVRNRTSKLKRDLETKRRPNPP